MGSDRCSCWKHDSDSWQIGATRCQQTWSLFSTSHNSKTIAISKNDQWFGQCWLCSLKRPIFLSGSFVVCVWRQWSSDQNDEKGRKPDNETCFQNPQSCSIGCSIESIGTPKIKIKSIDTKNQLADILTKGNFTRDEWNHLLCSFNISHFSSTDCSEVMSKRTQKDSGEERVTAKSKPMMNLVSRRSERTPDVLASTTSESPVKTRHESQNLPLSSWTEQQPRTRKLVKDAYSSNYSEWNYWRQMVFSRVEIWRSAWSKNRGDLFCSHSTRTDCWGRWYGL